MAFKPLRLVSFEDLKTAVIANSQTITIGDVVIPAGTTHAAAVTGASNSTTTPLLGVVISIMGANGQVLEKNSVTVASNNETVGIISVQFIPSYVSMEYVADMTAATGTTTSSNLMGMFTMDTGSNSKLLESSYAVFSTVKQFFSYGANPLNSSQVIGHFTANLGIL